MSPQLPADGFTHTQTLDIPSVQYYKKNHVSIYRAIVHELETHTINRLGRTLTYSQSSGGFLGNNSR
jgi:hypothetical protein